MSVPRWVLGLARENDNANTAGRHLDLGRIDVNNSPTMYGRFIANLGYSLPPPAEVGLDGTLLSLSSPVLANAPYARPTPQPFWCRQPAHSLRRSSTTSHSPQRWNGSWYVNGCFSSHPDPRPRAFRPVRCPHVGDSATSSFRWVPHGATSPSADVCAGAVSPAPRDAACQTIRRPLGAQPHTPQRRGKGCTVPTQEPNRQAARAPLFPPCPPISAALPVRGLHPTRPCAGANSSGGTSDPEETPDSVFLPPSSKARASV